MYRMAATVAPYSQLRPILLRTQCTAGAVAEQGWGGSGRGDLAKLWLDLGHGLLGMIPFLGQPAVEDLEDLVVGGGGAGRPAGEQVTHECLEVAAGGGLQAGAAAAQEGAGLPHGDEIGGDRAGRAVLGVEVPLEGADERVRAERVHEQEGYAWETLSIRYTAPGTGPGQQSDQRFRWSDPRWWARQGLNL
jgi:hypothetical protein